MLTTSPHVLQKNGRDRKESGRNRWREKLLLLPSGKARKLSGSRRGTRKIQSQATAPGRGLRHHILVPRLDDREGKT